ncbi:hypothetical protein [Clostridium tyrobutyricum]|jgi:hypothetical protein|uniref:hypothetical protein n=1 Tax=Clostridium tyrobutyricum TaxID=1519 RepID=UPI0003142957|nr:hypothetical protein [Clostridium tyrobutyricum]MBV4426880.1 hypothetical protein [Clostridium tyrobutyricum]MBV4429802.1 hypothetical protein [Clostridium tyrobutyricum]MBV4442036.1 hypothetical protein [Clostridium tyrobutyricum]MBV4445244.1 hypothetical protein [Clostridium tyrobutyricum]MCH4199381.1 hypothetical protein [Clostridium tyrobutyricum]
MWKTDIFELNSKNKTLQIAELQRIKVNLKSKKIIILVHGEEIYVENMIIPKIRKKSIYELIEEKLRNRFKKLDNIMFSYNINSHNKLELNVDVLCMNWDNFELFKKLSESKVDVKGVIPVQLYALEKYNKKIYKKQCIFLTFFKNIAYIIACYNNKIIFNDVFEVESKEDVIYCIEEFRLRLNILVPRIEFKHIEILNLPYKGLLEELSQYYNCNDLGELSI